MDQEAAKDTEAEVRREWKRVRGGQAVSHVDIHGGGMEVSRRVCN